MKVFNVKFKVDKFNGKNNLKLWKLKMHKLLVQQGLHKALVGKKKIPRGMKIDVREDLDTRALNTNCFCLVDNVLLVILLERI